MYKANLQAVHAFICAQLTNPGLSEEPPKNIVATAIEADKEVQKQVAQLTKSEPKPKA